MINFIKKCFSTIQDSVFSLLLLCSLILNIIFFISLGFSLFDKIILTVCASCILFLEVLLLKKSKRYFFEDYSGFIDNKLYKFFNTIIFKRLPGLVLFSLYLLTMSVSLAASYSFSLYSIYQASNKNTVLINNLEKISIKEDSLAAKNTSIKAKEELRSKLSPTINISDNSIDYNSQITTSEARIVSLNSQLITVQNSIINNTDEKIKETLTTKETEIKNLIINENKNVVLYTTKRNTTLRENKANLDSAKKDLSDYQKNYDTITKEIEILANDKINIQEEINNLKMQDEQLRRNFNKSQYKLISENLTTIFFSEKEIIVKKEITEEQVRATLLAIFSVMIEIGMFLTARKEEETVVVLQKKVVLVDKKRKIVDNNILVIPREKEVPKEEPAVIIEPIAVPKRVELNKIIEPIEVSKRDVIASVELPSKTTEKIKISSLEAEAERMIAQKPIIVKRMTV